VIYPQYLVCFIVFFLGGVMRARHIPIGPKAFEDITPLILDQRRTRTVWCPLTWLMTLILLIFPNFVTAQGGIETTAEDRCEKELQERCDRCEREFIDADRICNFDFSQAVFACRDRPLELRPQCYRNAREDLRQCRGESERERLSCYSSSYENYEICISAHKD
jgi:hypothetical protein